MISGQAGVQGQLTTYGLSFFHPRGYRMGINRSAILQTSDNAAIVCESV